MIGRLDPNHREVTVVGAGIAGLLAADELDRAGYEVTLLEAADRAGGLIHTEFTEWGLAESAAHSLLATPPVLALCERLGVELMSVKAESRARYVWRKGALRRFPLSIGEAFRAFVRAYLVLADRKNPGGDMTLEEWARRHLGEPALKYLIVPFVRGIYGARPSEIQVGMAFPGLVVPPGHSFLSFQLRKFRLRLMGREARRPARPHMMAPRAGMGSITSALESSLKYRLGERFKLQTPIQVLPQVRNLVLCVPASEAARLLESADSDTATALREVMYAPLISITAFVEKRSFPEPPCGVGVLLPEGTERKTLGILFNSSSFENRTIEANRWVSLTVMMGGTSRPDLLNSSDRELRAYLREDLEKILDLAPGASIVTEIHRWERAVPKYDRALSEAWRQARNGWCAKPGHVLFGNYTGQVSLRGMIDTVNGLSPSS